MRKIPNIAWHLLVWAVYTALSIWSHYKMDLFGTIYEGIVSNVISMVIFYTTAYWAFPNYFERKKYVVFSLAVTGIWLLNVALRYLFPFVIDPLISNHAPSTAGISHYLLIKAFTWHWFGISLYSAGFWFAKMRIEAISKLKDQVQLEANQRALELENTALRAQINPHFLFNTIGSFRSQIEHISPELGKDMESLMNIMESSIAKTGCDGMISFKQEIETIENLMSVYRRQFPDIRITYSNVVPQNIEYWILPHVLMSFVENALKHGAYYDAEKSIVIRIKEDKGDLLFAVYNKKGDWTKDNSVGIGIPLIKRHLENGYGDRQELIINDDIDEFSVFLRIKDLDRIRAKKLKPMLQA